MTPNIVVNIRANTKVYVIILPVGFLYKIFIGIPIATKIAINNPIKKLTANIFVVK